jgi:hypothetical protein
MATGRDTVPLFRWGICMVVVLSLLTPYPLPAGSDRGNAVPASRLPRQLRQLPVADHHIDAGSAPVGVVRTVIGTLVVQQGDGRAYFAAPGDRIYAKDQFITLDNSRCRIRFSTEDVITLAQNTRIRVDDLLDDRSGKKKRSLINMLRGKAMFYVVRLFHYSKSSANVTTPTAVCGVRGTKFGVEVREVNRDQAAVPLYLADASGAPPLLLAQARQPRVETLFFGFEGQIAVSPLAGGPPVMIGPGQNLVSGFAGLGAVQQTPPEVAAAFAAATEAPPPLPSGALPPPPSGALPAGDGTVPGETLAAAAGEALASSPETAASQAAQNATNQLLDQFAGRPVTHLGYFSTMLLNQTTGNVADVFISKRFPRQNFDDVDTDEADGLNGGKIDVDASGGSGSVYLNPSVVRVQSGGATITSDNPFGGVTEAGHNQYLEWGYWTAPLFTYPISGQIHAVTKGWYIAGDDTFDSGYDARSGSYTYAGTAMGTYSDGTTTTDLLGAFSCNVNFDADTISNFNMAVAGGGAAAALVGGAGAFNTGTLQGHSTFSAAGAWTLNGAAASGTLQGSLYGADGSAIGGAWGVYNAGEGANGIFQGVQQ